MNPSVLMAVQLLLDLITVASAVTPRIMMVSNTIATALAENRMNLTDAEWQALFDDDDQARDYLVDQISKA